MSKLPLGTPTKSRFMGRQMHQKSDLISVCYKLCFRLQISPPITPLSLDKVKEWLIDMGGVLYGNVS
jgi:hypothetical protein